MMSAYWPTASQQPDAGWHEIEHGNWYNQSHKIVFSNSLNSDDDKVMVLGDNSVEKLKLIKENSSKDLVIFGSPSIVNLLTKADLIDEYYIFIAPIILGSGVPLFDNFQARKNLKLIESKQLETEAVLLHYLN
jgi:dihydrofolate reductase